MKSEFNNGFSLKSSKQFEFFFNKLKSFYIPVIYTQQSAVFVINNGKSPYCRDYYYYYYYCYYYYYYNNSSSQHLAGVYHKAWDVIQVLLMSNSSFY
jgi:hypothetical protein